jgi:hypothetical protein
LQSQSALNEVQADLELSKANLNLSRLTVERWRRSDLRLIYGEVGVFLVGLLSKRKPASLPPRRP